MNKDKRFEALGKTINNKIKCPDCDMDIVGYFYWTCLNPKCSNYDRFAHEKCRNCGYPRHNCSC